MTHEFEPVDVEGAGPSARQKQQAQLDILLRSPAAPAARSRTRACAACVRFLPVP